MSKSFDAAVNDRQPRRMGGTFTRLPAADDMAAEASCIDAP